MVGRPERRPKDGVAGEGLGWVQRRDDRDREVPARTSGRVIQTVEPCTETDDPAKVLALILLQKRLAEGHTP